LSNSGCKKGIQLWCISIVIHSNFNKNNQY
jgi:hypothetical protein